MAESKPSSPDTEVIPEAGVDKEVEEIVSEEITVLGESRFVHYKLPTTH